MAYASEEEEQAALAMGYEVSRSPERGSAFAQGQRHIWSTRIGWQTADLVAGQYRHHVIYDDLLKALQREL